MMLKQPVPGRMRRVLGISLAVVLAAGAAMAAAGGDEAGKPPIADPETSYARMSPPRYPQEAIDARQAGTVVLRVQVLGDGVPGAVAIERSSGFAALDQSAIDAVRSWLFNPGMQDGRPVESWVLVPIEYRLDEDAPADDAPAGALDTLSVRHIENT